MMPSRQRLLLLAGVGALVGFVLAVAGVPAGLVCGVFVITLLAWLPAWIFIETVTPWWLSYPVATSAMVLAYGPGYGLHELLF